MSLYVINILIGLICLPGIFFILVKFLFFLGVYPWNDGPYLILRKDPARSITICWITAKRKDSRLSWGERRDSLPHTMVSSTSRFHAITLEKLSPDRKYHYAIEEDLSRYKRGTVFSFHTAPGKTSTRSAMFIAAGDLQPRDYPTFRSNLLLYTRINRENPDFIVQTGDTVQLGTRAGYWHYFLKLLPVMASTRPFLAAIGNHEHYIIHSARNFRRVFPYAYPAKKCGCYSVDTGNIHFTFLDPYDGGFNGMNSKITAWQKDWLESDLENAVHKNAEWIFLVLHQPVFTTGEYANDVRMRNWLLPVLSRFDIDVVFFGHSHLYEHWVYRYGANGYVLNRNDIPGGNDIHFFCIGSSGARLESSYKVFTHKPYRLKKEKWFNLETGKSEIIQHVQYPWNRHAVSSSSHQYCQYPFTEKGVYETNPQVSYSTINKWFGYRYGEITLHYAKIHINGTACTISIHYPDGSLLQGINGTSPQIFTLNKKKRPS